ncbi:MAG: hypothetical protein UZ18_ATM001000659 [Armatimonadetes bacterium OLB18]|nr:MAG: hypothetical protein UZ18_ATM001000659 [Armatimonadetes bacterium OLB18]
MDPVTYSRFLAMTSASGIVMRSLLVTTFRRNFGSRASQVPLVESNAEFVTKEDHIIFTQSYNVLLKDEASDDRLMSIRVVYEVALSCDKLAPEGFQEEYARRQLPLLTRPYLRELVSNCAPRSLIQAPPIAATFIPAVNQPVEDALKAAASPKPALKDRPKGSRPRPQPKAD